MMRNIGSYFKVVDADEHRIIEELRNLREKKRKDADDISAADAADAPVHFWGKNRQVRTENSCSLFIL